MPRLTNIDYLHIRSVLRQGWLDGGAIFGFLLPHEQWSLHDYCCPSEDVTDTEALQHRRDITKQRPSLPQQAGRAISMLERGGNPKARTMSGKIRVSGIVNPKIDADQLAQVLLHISAEWTNSKPSPPLAEDGSHVEDRAA